MKKKGIVILIFVLLKIENKYLTDLVDTLNDENGRKKLVKFIDQGAMNGFLFLSEFWLIIKKLQNYFPHYISSKLPWGQTNLKRDILCFYIGVDLVNTKIDYSKKNVIYFTALEKPNEPITLSMLYYIFLTNLHQIIHNKGESFFLNNIILFVPCIDIDNYLNINEMYGKIGWINDYIKFQQNNLFYRCFNDFSSSPYKTLSPVCSFEKLNQKDRNYIPFSGRIDLSKNLVSGISLHSDFDVFVYPEPWLFGLPHKQSKHLFNSMNHLYLNFKRNFFGPSPKFDMKGYMNLIDSHHVNNNYMNNNHFNNYFSELFPNINRIKQIVGKNYSVINYFLKMHIVKVILKKIEIFKLDKSDVVKQFDCIHKIQPNIIKFNFYNKSISSAYNLQLRIKIPKTFLNNLMKINFSTKKEVNNFDLKTIKNFDLAITEDDVWLEQNIIIGGKSSLFVELLILSMRIPINIKFYFLENNLIIKEFNYNF